MSLPRSVAKLCLRGFSSSTTSLQHSSPIPLTADLYAVRRGSFAELRDYHLSHFCRILSPERVLTDPSELEPYNVDWFKTFRGSGKVVLKPETTEEVSAILKFCDDENLAVVPQGGNTGVLGGSVPVFDEVIISSSRMNKIIKINDVPGSIVCQAGCVLEALDNTLAEHGLMMPLDLGAKGSCHIGGNIATNAGGLRLLRYGSLQANTLGLVAVKADGQIIDCMNTPKKDNTGYHLKHLFVGSEGTLGIVTEVAIQCPPKPQSVSMAFLGMKTFDHALQCFRLAQSQLLEIVSSCEVIDAESLQLVTNKLGIPSPLDDHPFYILLERLWQLRERIPEALFIDSYAYMYDISLPLDCYYQIVPELRTKLRDTAVSSITGFGHLGDGNLHLNICAPQFSAELLSQIEPYVFEWISERGGSISAEHGIGFKKTKFLRYSKTDAAIETMRQIKQLMDPKGILNPYKVLPPE